MQSLLGCFGAEQVLKAVKVSLQEVAGFFASKLGLLDRSDGRESVDQLV